MKHSQVFIISLWSFGGEDSAPERVEIIATSGLQVSAGKTDDASLEAKKLEGDGKEVN